MRENGKFNARVRLTEQMTRLQAVRLKDLSQEAYQPGQYCQSLSFAEAARRIEALEAEIVLADSF